MVRITKWLNFEEEKEFLEREQNYFKGSERKAEIRFRGIEAALYVDAIEGLEGFDDDSNSP